MTYLSSSLAFTSSSNVLFRAWGKWISDQLTTLGFTKTADTGQVDWTSVSAPGSGGTSAGYEVRVFGDALQSTAPIYFKIEYGSGTSAITPQVWLTAGGGSDGAGTITNGSLASTTASRAAMGAPSSAAAGTTGNVYAFGDGSCFGFLLWPTTEQVNAGMFFGIERFRSGDGTANANGFTLFQANSNSTGVSTGCRMISFLSGAPSSSATSNWLAPYPSAGFSSATMSPTATSLYPLPVFSGWSNRLYGPSQMLLTIGSGDVAVGATFTISHYGSSRTFLSAGTGNTTNNWGLGVNSAAIGLKGFAMRAD